MITVLGATGNTGRRIVTGLLAAGEEVRAVGRDRDRLVRSAVGAEPWVGELTDHEFLHRAGDGADAVYVLLPFDPFVPGYDEQQRAVGESVAAAFAEVPYTVVLSSLGAELDSDTGFLASLRDQERRSTGSSVLFLRPGLFFESFVSAVPAMRAEGVHVDSIDPDLPLPMVAAADVAEVAVAALLSRTQTGVREVLGPRDRTVRDVVAALGPRIGVPDLSYVQVSGADLAEGMLRAGLPADVADLTVRMNVAFNSGAVRSVAGRSAANSSPTEFEQWANALPVRPIG